MAICVCIFFAGWYTIVLLFTCSVIVIFQFLTTIWYMSVVYRDFTFPKAFRCVNGIVVVVFEIGVW